MTEKTRHRIIKKSLLIRSVEQKLLELFQQGKINGTVHTCIGQELIGVCAAEFLNDNDHVLSNHRGHGHFLSRNDNLVGFFAELMGRVDGICGGIGGSQHFYTHNHISNGIQGGMTPIGVGIALANKIKVTNNIVVCYIGDGTLGEGIIYEAFNLASLWELPIVFVLENNKVAQSTAIEQTLSGSIKERAIGFGLEYLASNTWDLEHLVTTFEKATTLSRKDNKAVFLEIDTYRLNSHSKGDDNRNPEEVRRYEIKDILNKELEENSDVLAPVLQDIDTKINEALHKVQHSPFTETILPIPSAYTEVTYSKQEGVQSDKRINELIHDALRSQFEKEENTIMIGEDIEHVTPWTSAPYGGAFKVSKDLSEHFKNVKNTPISEAAITGVGTGLSIGDMLPIIEIMFGDFMTLTFDQLYNHACKFHRMCSGQVSIPLIIRTPMGGKRGYGPTHSQSLEKHFLGITDLTMVALNYRIPPKDIYASIFAQKNPTIVIENKVLYTKRIQKQVLIGYEAVISDETYPTLKITPQKRIPDITILCYGEVLEDAEKAVELAFEEEEILCEIICPTQINPINIVPILQSIKNTQSLLTIEEGTNIAAYSSEVAALIMEHNVPLKTFKRLANNNIIPSSYQSELNIIPNENSILKKIKETYYAK
ncbi:dehydrogenase E1 protein subunits alpha/beta [Dokdonia pacifica]|uniref:2-oxoisovalerate dehydrogenase E1 component n=1 Tax=Dokdonia pacifica TaxID=1627892 RepID=A0A238Z1T8_9FLAO|nr:alpha-ketoacid dehydrogenase subunit alpha/beta [Dokdonia pacifica]GGG08701.1 dehydrogenase E1 protein subunits alpha/beta [Dokdonia pacifica]SNR77336.1 2-oxoisovalerate dehydrogenase E1 component [Dokdonia pacifica]